MKLKTLMVSGLLLTTLQSAGAWAHGRGWHEHDRDRYEDSVQYTWARVTRVVPITQTVSRSVPRQECRNQQVRVERPIDDYDSPTGTIVGGIIGGAIGNAVGHHTVNKKVGTAVGAILGASIGHDMTSGRYSGGSQVSYRDEYRCETYNDVSYDEEIVGYRVFYCYDGKTYETRTDYRPGDRIRVRVSVDPA